MRLAYVAGPYRGEDWAACSVNLTIAAFAAKQLIDLGFAVLSPHAIVWSLFGHQSPSDTNPTIDAMCEEWVKRCDLVVTYCDYSHSEGTKAEVALAHSLGIPVLTMEEVRSQALADAGASSCKEQI